jgi:hypothetical protein
MVIYDSSVGFRTPISLGFRAIIIISIVHGDIKPTRITVNTIARSSQAEDASHPSRLNTIDSIHGGL